MSDANKSLVRHVFEAVLPDPGGAANLERYVDPEFVDHDAAVPERARGVDSLRATHAWLHERFRGQVRFSVDEVIGEGDLVAVRWSAGPARAMAWFRVRDGKLIERWAIVRQLEAGP